MRVDVCRGGGEPARAAVEQARRGEGADARGRAFVPGRRVGRTAGCSRRFQHARLRSREGEVRTFARTRTGRIRPAYGERHDRAELLLVTGLEEYGYVDAFRALHGYSRRDRSWLYPHGKMGYRLDHVLVRGWEVVACEYRHDWRDAGLSDHAGMWAAFA